MDELRASLRYLTTKSLEYVIINLLENDACESDTTLEHAILHQKAGEINIRSRIFKWEMLKSRGKFRQPGFRRDGITNRTISRE